MCNPDLCPTCLFRSCTPPYSLDEKGHRRIWCAKRGWLTKLRKACDFYQLRIALQKEDGPAFLKMWNDKSPLPEPWNKGAEVAGKIKRND